MLRFLGMKSTSLCLDMGFKSVGLNWELLLVLQVTSETLWALAGGRGAGGARVHLSLAELGLFPLFFLHFPSATHNRPFPACSWYQLPERRTCQAVSKDVLQKEHEDDLVCLKTWGFLQLYPVGLNNR